MKFHGPKLVAFYYLGFRQPMVKKKNLGGGTPRSGPLKILKLQNFQNVTPMTSYNPIFLLQNHLVLSKLGCLQKKLELKILERMADIFAMTKDFCDHQDRF